MNICSFEEEMLQNTKLKLQDIDKLKEWLKTQPHLPKMKEPDLVLFLHKHYYSDMEMTMETIDKYFTLRTHSPEFFRDRDPVNSRTLRDGFNTLAVIPLEKRTRKGFKVILMKFVDTNPLNYNYNHTVTYMNAVLDVCIREEGTRRGMCRGYAFLFDLSGYTTEHIKHLTYLGLKKLIDYYMDAAPIRWIGAHFVNSSSEHRDPHVQRLIKSHLTDLELSELSYFHEDMRALNTFIPLEILPKELGGEAGRLMDLHRVQMIKLENNRDWLVMSETSYIVNESLRPKKPTNEREVFGKDKNFTASAEDI